MSKRRDQDDYKERLKAFAERNFGVPAKAKPPMAQPRKGVAPAAAPATAAVSPPARPVIAPPKQMKGPRSAKQRNLAIKRGLRPTNLPPLSKRGGPVNLGDAPRRKASAPASTAPENLLRQPALDYVLKRVDLASLERDAPAVVADPRLSEEIRERLSIGSARLAERAGPDQNGYIVGFDFGTSCSKVVVHQLGANEPAYALPVPRALQAIELSGQQDHLWISAVWLDPATGVFSLAPTASSVRIAGFKTGLIQGEGHRMEQSGVTHSAAACAYLALLIAYVVGHHAIAAPPGLDRARHFSRFHFGVPFACKEAEAKMSEFRSVLAAAFALAPHAPNIRLDAVRAALLRHADTDAEPTGATPYILYEELAGVIAGYRASPDHRYEQHVVVDVGAATLDVAAFHLPQGPHPTLVYMSAVGLLGSEALRSARLNQVPDPTFRAACVHHTRRVINYTFLRKDVKFLFQNGKPKPLLYVGGGRSSDVHQELYKNYGIALEAPLVTPLPSRGTIYDAGTDFARLLLAWGLAQEETELPKLKPPSEIEDEIHRSRDFTTRFIDKDMC